ncbi:hypothetical protein ILYODFUR_005688 [Ilyodon furcidens]|uniref:Uncharacterized protein n=1 Tax=Ilyodon furcidens TaxID=33524 RepID=A0ABV0VBD9_9TELE
MASLLKCDADYARCNICDVKCKASGGNTSNLKKRLVEHKIFLKAEEFTFFISLRSTATTPGFGAVSTPASVSNTLSAARNMEKKCLKQLRCCNTNSWMLF